MNNLNNIKDPYKTLGIPHTASESEIRKAYQKLARKYHPDRQSNPINSDNINNDNNNNSSSSNHGEESINHEEKMAEINSAYEILKDPDQKRQYDRLYRFGAFGTVDDDNLNYEMRRRREQRRSYRDDYYDLRRPFPSNATSSNANHQFRSSMSSSSGSGFTMSFTTTSNDARTGIRKVMHKTTRFNNGKKFTQVETTTYFPDGRTEQNIATHEEENASVFGHILKSMLGLSTEPKTDASSKEKEGAKNRNNEVHEDDSNKVAWYHNLSNSVKKCVGI